MIRLVDFLSIKPEDYKNYKIHFATGADNKRTPYEKFLIDGFDEWQAD